MSRSRRIAVVLALSVLVAVATACAPKPEPKPEPKVAPPAVTTAGALVAGVDLDAPPFAGVDEGKKAGIDVDVASALADRLGLAVSFVDVKPSEAASAVASGAVDVVLSVPYDDSALSLLNLAGTYITDAPALFVAVEGTASVEPSRTLDSIVEVKVAAQKESESYWILRQQIDPEIVDEYATLRDAMQALSDGRVQLMAGDAIVANYIARDFPSVRYAGTIGPASPLAVAVAADNTALADAVRTSLDGLAADGVLDTIRRKWLGDAPKIEVENPPEAAPTP
jgi:polar amino acid transport system substrate-binding protein